MLDAGVSGINHSSNENTESSNNITSGGSPLTSASNNYSIDNTGTCEKQPQNRGHQQQPLSNGKMLRKRMASEIDMEVQTLTTNPGMNDYIRFSRRSIGTTANASSMSRSSFPAVAAAVNNSYVASGDNFPRPNPKQTNYSTSLPSSTTLTTMTSGGGSCGFLSCVTTPANFSHDHSDQNHHQGSAPAQPQSQTPAVCGFSGLPLFPSERYRNINNTNSSSRTVPNIPSGGGAAAVSPSMEDSSATAWIDGIIKDLIHSSNNVSVPQLIQNVKEIIYPCNPNLAALLEYRLRSLTSADPIPNYPERRRPVVQPPQPQQQGQLQGSSERMIKHNLLDSGLPNFSSTEPMNQLYLHWENSLNQLHHQVQEPRQQEQENSSPAETAAPPTVTSATTSATTTNTSTNTNSSGVAILTREKKEEMRQQKRDEEGLHLLTLLLQCAEAVSADNFEEANKMLQEISELSTPFGTAAQRVAAYFSEAMSARLVSSCLGIYAALPPPHGHSYSHKMASAFQVFNGISPLVKFSHFTANQAIQEAFEREERVHIIDLDIMQGLQWPGLFHILASRPGGPPYVRLTGLGTSMEALEATGKRLSDFAEKLGLPFEFIPVADKVGNLDPESLNVSKREALAVHWLQHSLYDVTGSDNNTLWLLQRYHTQHKLTCSMYFFN
jgi:hypothetical protein